MGVNNMQIEEKIINNELQLIELIKNGVNLFDYIKNEKDIDFVSSAIAHINKSEDPFLDDAAEILIKSFIYYLLSKDGEIKSLKRCKEMVELGLDENNGREKITAMISCDEISAMLFKHAEIATDRTFKGIFETLDNKLNEILK